jgi:hypothetical protein
MVVDVTAPRGDGQLTVAADGRLFLFGLTGTLTPFARGRSGYSSPLGGEPYITVASNEHVAGTDCSFARDTVFALDVTKTPGVIAVDLHGQARRWTSFAGVTPNGIAFDNVGRFGHRLLVSAVAKGVTHLFSVDCTGHVHTIAANAPTVEGGIVVAPLSFGSFGGDVIAPDELTGKVWAIGPDGNATLVARSPLPHGQDLGVESAGFVPSNFNARWAAYVADRRTPHNPHPGNDSILRISGGQLATVGVRAGDLLIAAEGSGQTISIRCGRTCTVQHIADGPPTSHIEGHLILAAQ